jgi:stalled ribosome rescue protein Dom34
MSQKDVVEEREKPKDEMHSHIAISRLGHGKFRVFDIRHSATQWGTTTYEDIDLKLLARISDLKPTFVSVYLDMDDEKRMSYFSKRVKLCESLLKNDKELYANFVSSVEKIKDYLNVFENSNTNDGRQRGLAKGLANGIAKGSVKGLAIFSSNAKNFFESYELPFRFENAFIVDTSPYIRYLARELESWENYCILHLDKNHARIYVASSLKIFDADNIEKDILHHHRKGGMSQMRYQRLYDGKVLHFYKEVAEELQKIVKDEGLDKIIIAGPHDAKSQIMSHLPVHIQKKVVGNVDLPINAKLERIMDETLAVLQKAESVEDREIVNALHDEVLREGLGIYGIEAIYSALKEGNVDMLMIEKGKVVKVEKCENCGKVKEIREQKVGKCEECGNQMYVVDVFEEMIELAENIDAKIRFVAPSEGIESFGGAGAFLRFARKK